MHYELAKQLSDAGFPQGGEGKWVPPPDIIIARREDRVYVPTLSELIEACGSNFQALFREPDRWTAQQELPAKDPRGVKFHIVPTAVTPEDAMALLWLALNKKP